MFVRIGSYFVDVTKITRITIVEHSDQRDNDTYKTVRIELETGTDLEAIEVSETEARNSSFLKPFLTGAPYVSPSR
jgi:hypothetical protein